MKTIIDRGSLTDLVVSALGGLGFPVGDGEAPLFDAGDTNHAGWNGEPDAPGSVFVPYIVVVPQTAVVSSGPFSDPQDNWQVPYGVSFFGVTRKQVESVAHRGREALRSLGKTTVTLDGDSFKVQQVQFSALGGVGRVDASQPSTFGEVDTITIWLSQ